MEILIFVSHESKKEYKIKIEDEFLRLLNVQEGITDTVVSVSIENLNYYLHECLIGTFF